MLPYNYLEVYLTPPRDYSLNRRYAYDYRNDFIELKL